MSQIYAVRPYLCHGFWVFDDATKKIKREPFTGSDCSIIRQMTQMIPNASIAFLMSFSNQKFPQWQVVLDWMEEEGGGNVYRWMDEGVNCWLPPMLQKYFPTAPEQLFLRFDEDRTIAEAFRPERLTEHVQHILA